MSGQWIAWCRCLHGSTFIPSGSPPMTRESRSCLFVKSQHTPVRQLSWLPWCDRRQRCCFCRTAWATKRRWRTHRSGTRPRRRHLSAVDDRQARRRGAHGRTRFDRFRRARWLHLGGRHPAPRCLELAEVDASLADNVRSAIWDKFDFLCALSGLTEAARMPSLRSGWCPSRGNCSQTS